MGLFYEHLIRPMLFKQEAEKAHDLTTFALHMLGEIAPLRRLMEMSNLIRAEKPVKLFGLEFPNRVGIAAGFDKNAETFKATAALGFGHIEIGTVTHQRQPGNPKPRFYRIPQEQALINKMGFNNEGAVLVAKRLSKHYAAKKRRLFRLGINLGKSKAVPIEEAVPDYLSSYNLLADYADYFTINISSLSSQGTRAVQFKRFLQPLLEALSKANQERAKKMGFPKIPMLLKISPDLSVEELDELLEIVQNNQFAGVIATNTTLQRPTNWKHLEYQGGLSGKPLFSLTLKAIRYIHLKTEGKLPIVATGGISSPEQAGMAIDNGASLVQLYTGLEYKGPFLGKCIAKGLNWIDKQWV